MIFGTLNCSTTIQRKLPAHYLSPSIPYVWKQVKIFGTNFLLKIWCGLLVQTIAIFHLQWTSESSFKENVFQILVGPSLKPQSKLSWWNAVFLLIVLWSNALKVFLAEIWFERKIFAWIRLLLSLQSRCSILLYLCYQWHCILSFCSFHYINE